MYGVHPRAFKEAFATGRFVNTFSLPLLDSMSPFSWSMVHENGCSQRDGTCKDISQRAIVSTGKPLFSSLCIAFYLLELRSLCAIAVVELFMRGKMRRRNDMTHYTVHMQFHHRSAALFWLDLEGEPWINTEVAELTEKFY